MHVLHVPLRVGWQPQNVRALLSKIIRERPGPDSALEPSETWDNATLACEVLGGARDGGQRFPMILETKRIAPGKTSTWSLKGYGTRLSAEFSTKYPETLRTLPYTPGGVPAWQSEDLGPKSAYPTIAGGIFEFGFSDSILQMWAAFCGEAAHRGAPQQPFGCVTPAETAQSHALLTAALLSQKSGEVVSVPATRGVPA